MRLGEKNQRKENGAKILGQTVDKKIIQQATTWNRISQGVDLRWVQTKNGATKACKFNLESLDLFGVNDLLVGIKHFCFG